MSRPPGVPDNVPGKRRPPSDDSSEDEDDESKRARRLLTSKLPSTFDKYDPKFYCLRYTSSGKPYRKRTKPYHVFAANSWGYLRKNIPESKMEASRDSEKSGPIGEKIDEDSDNEDEIGLRTIAFPHVVKKIKEKIAKEIAAKGMFSKTVNDVFREQYYIEFPYCTWCEFRPCMCYV